MGNPFYRPGSQRAAGVQDLFGRIAERYDLINDLQSFGLHRWWKRRLVALTRIQARHVALDVCCGTGDVALQLARHGAAVVGLDFSEAMIAVARRRARSRSAPQATPTRLSYVTGDALRIPFADQTFDAVTISYGLRNLAGLEAGVREMWRVLKPGGCFVALDFGKPDRLLWRKCYFSYLGMVVPLFGRSFAGTASAYAYILESLHHYPGQRAVAGLLEALPGRHVRTINFLGGIMAINYAEKPG